MKGFSGIKNCKSFFVQMRTVKRGKMNTLIYFHHQPKAKVLINSRCNYLA
jgi:hypothetical protein